MARDNDDDYYDFGSLPEGQQQEFLYDQLGFVGAPRDYEAHNMFWDVMYNDELTSEQRLDTYEAFASYMFDEYGIDFADVWDWEDFREWYDASAG